MIGRGIKEVVFVKRRLGTIVLMVAMLVSLLPMGNLFAASDIVSSLDLYVDHVPVSGEVADNSVYASGANSSKVIVTPGKWKDGNGNVLDTDDCFEDFNWYTLEIDVKFKEVDFRRYGFYRWVPADVGSFTLNTNTAVYTKTLKKWRESSGEDLYHLTVTLTFKVITNCYSVELKNFGESLYAGGKADYTFSLTDARYCDLEDTMKWYPTNSPSSIMGPNDLYIRNIPYTLEFQLTAKDHVRFDSYFQVDALCDSQDVSISGTVATVKLHYDSMPNKVTSLSITGLKTPAKGAKPQTSGITFSTSYLKPGKIEWDGSFASDGTFKSGEKYLMLIHFETVGNTYETLTASSVTVNAGKVIELRRYEVGYPAVVIEFTVAGKKDLNDLGELVIDMTKDNQYIYYYSADTWKNQNAYQATAYALKKQTGFDYASSGSKDVDKNGVNDIILNIAGGVYDFERLNACSFSGRYTIKINSTAYAALQDVGTYTDYYSSVTFILPSKPVGSLKAASAGRQKVTLSWTGDKGSDGYLIYGQKDKKYAYVGMTKSTTFTDSKALDTDYNYYWVFSFVYNKDGKMVPSGCAKYVYAKGVTAAVTNLKANGTTGKVTLTWNASAGADGYLIYGIRPGGKYGYIGMTTTGVSYVDTKASKTGWTYYWVFPYHKDAGGNMIVGGTAPYVYSKAR